jgi:2-oxo-3-hexenedioate decarboxylase
MQWELAKALWSAEKNRREIRRITLDHPSLSVGDAYGILDQLILLKQGAGQVSIGYKLGYTSEAMRRQMGVNQPSYGVLFDDMMMRSGDTLLLDELIHPKVEAEIAFVLNKDIKGPGITAEEVLEATDYVLPALEVVDSRYIDYTFTGVDVIADNNSAARVILGERGEDPHAFDLTKVQVHLLRNRQLMEEGQGADVLGHPGNAVAWLANFLADRGTYLIQGQIVISGGMTKAVDLERGDEVCARFGRLGEVKFSVI